MTIHIKNSQEIEKMRIAGKLASEVLDYITPFVNPGITTEEIDRLCHDFMVNVQKNDPCSIKLCSRRTYTLSKINLHVH